MLKTTVYLEEDEMRALKGLAGRLKGVSAATLIREAIRDLLRKKKRAPAFRFLRKRLAGGPKTSSFGDAVGYQRAIRKDWN